jgi:hypothetical protein
MGEQMGKDIRNDSSKNFERFSRRFQSGVEILEHDSVNTISVKDGKFKMTKQPRLVIEGAVAKSKDFISKSRSQLGEVDTFLRNIIHRPAGAK